MVQFHTTRTKTGGRWLLLHCLNRQKALSRARAKDQYDFPRASINVAKPHAATQPLRLGTKTATEVPALAENHAQAFAAAQRQSDSGLDCHCGALALYLDAKKP